jgi:hypothetical protein
MHDQGSHRYEHVRVGHNSRLDPIQAAILLKKQDIVTGEIEIRNVVADRYNAAFFASKRSSCPMSVLTRSRPGRSTPCRWRTATNSRPISGRPAFHGLLSDPLSKQLANRAATQDQIIEAALASVAG